MRLRMLTLFLAIVPFQPAFTQEPSDAELKALNGWVNALSQSGKSTEAIPFAERYAAHIRPLFDKNAREYAMALYNLARLLEVTNRLDEAEPLYRSALAIDEASLGKDHPNVATDLNNLARLLQAKNRLEEAEQFYRRALAIDQASFGKDHQNVATDLDNLARLLQARNPLHEGQDHRSQARQTSPQHRHFRQGGRSNSSCVRKTARRKYHRGASLKLKPHRIVRRNERQRTWH
jgi:tetratricopeptide (TPR) repeat protein